MNKKERERKVEALLSEITLEEKIGMIHGSEFFKSAGVERLGIPPIVYSDGPNGVRKDFEPARMKEKGTTADEVGCGPCNTSIASTWNRSLAWGSGRMLGEEARGRGKDMILAPGINIKRNPLCGRNFEYMSEDPYLISELVVPLIEGIQETDVSACVKHFACNAQEYERFMVNVEVSDRALREIYFPGFEAAVKKAKTRALMGAYNLVRGSHASQNKWLLTDVLRKEWKYNGLVVSDWGAIHDTKAAAESGLDVEMAVIPEFDDYYMAKPLLKAVKAGEIDESLVDEKVRNIIRFLINIRKIDVEIKKTAGGKESARAVPVPERNRGTYSNPAHAMRALDTARESVILLKNEDKRLPILPEKAKKILVIGDNADRKHSDAGGSAEVKALFEVTPLLGITKSYGGNTVVDYARGYYVPEEKKYAPDEQMPWEEYIKMSKAKDPRYSRTYSADEKKLIKKLKAEALALAAEYDEVIFVGGLNHEYDVEDKDRRDMKLPFGQDELINDLLDVNPNMVIVMFAGSPVDMTAWSDRAKAIVLMAYNGMEGGSALGEVISGKVNPSGKLPETLPMGFENTPVAHFGEYPGRKLTKEESGRINANITQTFNEGVFVGYRYYEKFNVPVQFPFGHGLSYTKFTYRGLSIKDVKGKPVDKRKMSDGLFVVSVKVKNTGDTCGKETVQFYTGEANPSKDNPVKELNGFEKIELKPGEEKTVSVVLPVKAFSHYDESVGDWVMMKGEMKIYAASSSADVRLTKNVKI
ncbi:beta-glucosidase [Lachnospiraceae bacterium XPB1003]|nr:beta-glucosidase [Lachnospiraceae bacterium XPB1003]